MTFRAPSRAATQNRPTTPAARRRLAASLLRYRVIAYIVGTGLLLLVLVAMPLKYFADSPGMVAVVGTAHGFLFLVYILAAVDLSFRARFSLVKGVLVIVAGTIPFFSFVAERKVTAELRREGRV
jgi:integral membrane protein